MTNKNESKSLEDENYSIYYEPRFYEFHSLMKRRINNVLIVSNLYERFLLEEDGRLGDQILDEYLNLHLSNPPRLHGCINSDQALDIVRTKQIDLIITMKRIGDLDPFTFATNVKKIHNDIPVVLLLTNRTDMKNIPKETKTSIDKIFLWTGDSKIFLAIVKLFEDRLNSQEDISTGKVQAILLIENSIHYYSVFLPMLYSEIMKQTHQLISQETVNEFHRLLRMRTRPKIFFAESFEEAIQYFDKYKDNLLGVLSDVAFPMIKNGEININAGSEFIKKVKEHDKFLPTLLMSSQLENLKKAQMLQSSFIYKHSPKALHFLRKFLIYSLGFGEFVFRLPNGNRVASAKNLEELKDQLKLIPDESIVYHASNNHFSNWLMARGEFEIAYSIRPKRINDFKDTTHLREFLINSIDEIKYGYQSGTIADFNPEDFGKYDEFSRLGQGSLGGKGRGLAFLQNLLSRSQVLKEKYPNVQIKIPLTFVICTEEFDQFIEFNLLYDSLNPTLTDEQIIQLFVNGRIQTKLEKALKVFIESFKYPIAVRSSSLLEDSLYQPFAGVYKTFMLPNNDPDDESRLHMLLKAIKLVYASMFLALPRYYLENITTLVEQEKMAVVIQEIVGNPHDNHFYPDISGVAQSYNYYPFRDISPEDGTCQLALGLGKFIVDGDKTFSFCPKYPQVLPQMANNQQFLKNSQSYFYSLSLDPSVELTYEETSTLLKNNLDVAEKDEILFQIGSVYDPDSDVIRDGISWSGPRLVTFAGILKHHIIPLDEILQDILYIGKKSFGSPVEIEFAINLKPVSHNHTNINNQNGNKPTFNLLQIRPFASGFIDSLKTNVFDLQDDSSTLAFSTNTLGNGLVTLNNIVFVKKESFDRSKTYDIALEIRNLNASLKQQKKPYLLIGFGRWGSSDNFLGIPVKWNEIAGAEAIIEINFMTIEPSFGSHFFANITGLNIPYFTIPSEDAINSGKLKEDVNGSESQDSINWDILNSLPVVTETNYLKHVTVEKIEIIVDGRSRKGIIKLGSKNNESMLIEDELMTDF
jgi:hypothetical protein